ncbi:unnamed protein product [Paramecium sonneborni]|uniref:PPM-type phosphatase domain-containing protein n=1 Tax=Paramecium sonneborni TaxID=65129 RepID=A0A8S1L7E7_9CILI|nr:unnamed protein product [Paramecium sonneborni]
MELHRTQKPLLQKRYKATADESDSRNHKISLPSLTNFRKTEFNSLENIAQPISIINQGNGIKIPNRLPKLERRSEISKSKYEIQFNQTPKDEEQKLIQKQKKTSFTPEQRISESPEKKSTQSKKKGGGKQWQGMKYVYKTKAGCQTNKQTKTNQDSAIIFPQNIDSQNYGLVGICDGHGVNGHLVSDIIKKRMPSK